VTAPRSASAVAVGTVDAAISEQRCGDLLGEFLRIRSVNGERTTAHLWLSERLARAGLKVESYRVEDLPAPLLLGRFERGRERPGVLFDAHYDTVFADPADWSHDPWGGVKEGNVLYGRGAVDSKGAVVAMIVALEAIASADMTLKGPIYYMSDSDGEGGFRGAALTEDLGIRDLVGTVFSGEATGNCAVEIAYPGISAWKISAIGRAAHPTEPEKGINAVTKMARLVDAVAAGKLTLRDGTSEWFKPRVTTNAIRTVTGGGWSIPARCDCVLSVLTPQGVTVTDVGDDIDAFLRRLEVQEGDVRFEHKVLPMGAGRLWLRPGESDPQHPGVHALRAATREVTGRDLQVGPFNGGWVDAVEMMRPTDEGYSAPACLTFGPGDFALAHSVDEHICIADVADCARIYARAALELLT